MVAKSYCYLQEVPQYMLPPPWVPPLDFAPPFPQKISYWGMGDKFLEIPLLQMEPQGEPCALKPHRSNAEWEMQNKKLDLLFNVPPYTTQTIIFRDCISNIFYISCWYITVHCVAKSWKTWASL